MKRYGATIQKNPFCQIFCTSPLAGTFFSDQRSLFYLQVVANQEGIEMSGYLRFKKGRHGWKKSWFVLKNNVLYSYKASSVGNNGLWLQFLPNLPIQRSHPHSWLPAAEDASRETFSFTSRGVTKEWEGTAALYDIFWEIYFCGERTKDGKF